MPDVTITADASGAIRELRMIPGGIERAVASWLPKVGQLGVATMRNVTRPLLKHPKGPMLASVQADPVGDEIHVQPHVPYWRAVDTGAKPHIIRPRNRSALTIPLAGGVIGTRGKAASGLPRRVTRFSFGGKTTTTGVRFAKVVHHPGFHGYFFIEKTAQALPAPSAALLEAEMRKEVDRSA